MRDADSHTAKDPIDGGDEVAVDDVSDAREPDPDTAPPAGYLTNLLCGVVIALVGVGALIVALDLGFGSLAQPRAGTWPAIVSGVLIVVGLVIAVRAATFTDAERITRDGWGVVAGVVSLVVAAQLMPLVGFEIPSFVLMVFWMSVLGRERLLLSVPISAVTVAVFYLIFVYGLAVPIPRLFS
ncbi:tripartite tricarboxylate transporter TctB family protein [Spiractinospora alimapuensis]|uniref:tripartite tricarboxylate transporter TctB family protein n=1 Tax=Spiractinospora alimapuensis TaxID=2820884 RepID=UPI001F38C510|nr:tripartite tricarboxylate transporter TctB family protein [Spiractinospora alimapuensis]QVQ51872.1 tripartite tricarboxylate transporter TctB family protein [Spiractinospora alimapuensis]